MKEIEVISNIEIKKDSEYDIIINVPSAIGKIKYYCKLKKKVEDSDVKNAIETAKSLNLPIYILTSSDFDENLAFENPDIIIHNLKDE